MYDADSLALLDSIPLPNRVAYAETSPDGQSLYVTGWWQNAPDGGDRWHVAKIDVLTGRFVWTNALYDGLQLSLADEGRVVVYGSYLLDAMTGVVTGRLDCLEASGWWLFFGPRGSAEVAVAAVDSMNAFDRADSLMALNVVTGEVRGSYVPRLAPDDLRHNVHNARLHP